MMGMHVWRVIMKKHYVIFSALLIAGLLISFEAWSLTCYITMAKDNCWKDYNVLVDVQSGATNARIIQLNIPKGQNFARQSFECKPRDNFYYVATFTPVIWEDQAGQKYRSKLYWAIPGNIPADYVVWEVKACYPSDFAQVPITPEATDDCRCDFSSIPPIKASVIGH